MSNDTKCPDCGGDMFCFDGGGPDHERHKHDVGGLYCIMRQLAAKEAECDRLARIEAWLASEGLAFIDDAGLVVLTPPPDKKTISSLLSR